MKKRGFGKGRWNGTGGKVKPGETIEAAAIRECFEEIGVKIKSPDKRAIITFLFPDGQPDWLMHTFEVSEWEGEPAESEEMRPEWFHIDDIPYGQMWDDDAHWLPKVLAGEKLKASFAFDATERLIEDSVSMEIVETFEI